MTYIYRATAHCDRRDSGRCHGLLEVSSTQASSLARIHGKLHERGWLRTRTPQGLADVCPGCQTADERTVATAAARANGRKPVAPEPVA